MMVNLIENHILNLRDEDLWDEREFQLNEDIETLDNIIEGLS